MDFGPKKGPKEAPIIHHGTSIFKDNFVDMDEVNANFHQLLSIILLCHLGGF